MLSPWVAAILFALPLPYHLNLGIWGWTVPWCSGNGVYWQFSSPGSLLLDWFAPIANCHSHNFDSLLAIGLFAMILFQVMVNIGMTIGLLEVTGMPLPLVRYGRSALLSTYLGLGMVLSIANHRPRSRY